MKKKLGKAVSAILCASLIFALCAGLTWADTEVSGLNDVTWSGESTAISYSSGVLTISGDGTLTISSDVTISGGIYISSGTVTISVDENATLSNSDADHDLIYICSGAVVTLKGGTYKHTSDSSNDGEAVVWNEGTCTIESGTYYNASSADKAYYTIVNNGTMTINDGSFSNDASSSNSSLIINSQDYKGATLTITGGTFTTAGSACVKNDTNGTLSITGGTYSGKSYNYGIVNYGTATVSNATISTYYGVYNKISTDNESSVNASIKITNCKITTSASSIYNYSGAAATVKDCTITTSGNYSVYNTGTATVEGCTIEASKYGIVTNASTASTTVTNCAVSATAYCAIYNAGGTTTVNGGTYTSTSSYAVYNTANGTTTIYDGEFSTSAENYTAVKNVTSTTSSNGTTTSYESSSITIYHGDFSDDSAESYLATTYTNDDGETVYTYSVTDDNGDTVIHALVYVAATEATCTTDGNIAHYKCSYDGCTSPYFTYTTTTDDDGNETITYTAAALTEITIAATGHTWGDPEITWSDDCSEITIVYTCTVCGETFTVTDYVITSVENEDGSITYTATYEDPYGKGCTTEVTITGSSTAAATGDSGIALWIVLIALAGCGALGIGLKRRFE